MRPRSRPVVASVVAAGLAVAVLMQPRADAAEPPADVSAFYAGKGVSNTGIISGTEPGGKGGFSLTLQATQEGNDLAAVLTIDGEEIWGLMGRVGRGRFWLAGDVGDGDFVAITGTAKGKPGKLSLKGKGSYLADDHYSEMKISVKQSVE